MYWESDANKKALEGKKVAVLGYGSQGRAQALNLRDSGINVVLGLRAGSPTWKQAEGDGWKPEPVAEAVKSADIVCMLVPDIAQAQMYKDVVAANLKPGAMLLFSHGFNIHYKQIEPPETVDVAMIAPKSPGGMVRRTRKATAFRA
jgi:ketol-acid reductoisomerase